MPSLKPHVVHLATPDDMEQQFYEAMRQGDVDRMMTVWADDEDIVCVHPGGPRLAGPAAIRGSFEALFASGGVEVRCDSARRLVTHSSAVHSVVERLQVRAADGPRAAWVIATNVYQKTPQGWRLVAHHASPGSAQEPEPRSDPGTTLH